MTLRAHYLLRLARGQFLKRTLENYYKNSDLWAHALPHFCKALRIWIRANIYHLEWNYSLIKTAQSKAFKDSAEDKATALSPWLLANARETAGLGRAELPQGKRGGACVCTHVCSHTGCPGELRVFSPDEQLLRAISPSLLSPINASCGLLNNLCKQVTILLPL